MRRPALMLVGLLTAARAIAGPLAVIPQPPIAVESDGHVLLAFELHLRNPDPSPLTVNSVRLTDPDSGRELALYDGAALANRLAALGGETILYVELTGYSPRKLMAEILCTEENGPAMIRTAPIPVATDAPAHIGPPFAHGIWVAVHSPDWARGHRRVAVTLGGKITIPGRFAIDWVGVDDQGLVSHDDPDRPSDAIGYGEPVLAGADATVVAVRDDMAESASIKNNPKHGIEGAAGNYVALAIGGGRFLFYEHLRPGSLRVKPGQKIGRGDIIGELGFSGDSTGPHLHMHVADSADPIAAEGLPFIQEGFARIGRYRDVGRLGTTRWEAEDATRPDWPGPNVVGTFGD